MRISLALGSLAALVAMLAPHAGAAQRAPALAPAFSAKELTASPTDSWITNGGNVYNQRYSPLTRINRDNVAQLKPQWRTHLNGSGTESKYSGQAQPLVYDGVIYVPTGANDVFALDVETGKILWTYQAHLDAGITVVCCGWMSRGVALGDGKIYAGQLDGKLVALDQRTGAVVWSVQAETNADGFSITTAPLYYDGLVITGFAGGDRGEPRPREGIRRDAPASSLGRSTRSRVPASSGTTHGPPTTTRGSTAARPSGRRPPSIRAWGSSISRRAIRAPT